jgi:hypothetical protein
MKQRTINNNKNENMKMRKTLITAVALAACVSTQLFAQNKEDVMTFALTGSHQSSVSTSPSSPNKGNWSDGPMFYKTTTTKLTDQDVIKFIAFVQHGNATYYSSKAHLVLVQGELSGFFNITPDLGLDSWPYNRAGNNYSEGNGLDGYFYSDDGDCSTAIANSQDSSFVTLDNGHHFLLNDFISNYPVGHMQPWGQIYVKDPANAHQDSTVLDPYCENVTYFFAMTVEECYDCFYMNSFISDATFKVESTTSALPCCGNPSTLVGKGKDRYYLSLSFDNTQNNPYLYSLSSCYVGVNGIIGPIKGDGIVPDKINNEGLYISGDPTTGYHDSIVFNIGKSVPYEARFTLEGILTYTWTLEFVNKSDLAPDFIGTASYAANGYGFIGLYCSLLTGTATFKESIVKTTCCDTYDNCWYDDWYGVGAEYVATDTSSIGYESKYYYDYYTFNTTTTYYYQTPMNVSTSLSFHENFDKANYPWDYLGNLDGYPSGWSSEYPDNGVVTPLFVQ